MSGSREEALELPVRDDHRRVIHEGVRVNGVGIPEPAIDDEIDRVRGIVDEREQAHGTRRNAEMINQPRFGREPQSPCPQLRTERMEVDREIMRNGDEKVVSALLVAQEKVLGPGARQARHESLRLLDRHDRRMLEALRVDGVLRKKGDEIHAALHADPVRTPAHSRSRRDRKQSPGGRLPGPRVTCRVTTKPKSRHSPSNCPIARLVGNFPY